MYPDTSTEPSIFAEQVYQPAYATTGQRFANFIVDMIVAYGLVIVLTFMAALTIAPLRDFFVSLNDGSFSSKMTDRILTALLVALTFTVIEGATKGLTLGKLITGTRAVNFEDGSPITWKQAFQRSFSRIVPFEAFSGFGGSPWHDRWSGTCVVKTR